ncbi:hypothetical protein [Natronococcus occultus]|uniref:Glutamate--cysteine ligase n=1 Tax=Natronococcus occultus SP4 TaxID=694430 RepID=L0JWI1_9EURY|nr:hypothetical protein [Natronococcus occultus]AGB36218.1 hypothetical protein Natoc_0352 [Natronococcus occultus SP4]
MDEYVELVDRSLRDATRGEFARRVDEQGDRLTEVLRDGGLDSPGFGIGLELEAYAVDDDGRLARVPKPVFEGPCEKELGVHNVEFNTDPNPFDGDGIAAQAAQLRRDCRRGRAAAEREGTQLVLDGMWAIPPREGTAAYLTAVRDRDGVTIAENMTPSPRYYAIDNHVRRSADRLALSVPGVDREFPSILFESLTSSIQPHVQIPSADRFPRYYNTARGTLGPVLALATNSPLLPVDLYDPDDPSRLLDETFHELRIPVFEQSINRAWEKVRVPDEITDAADTVDRLVADPTCAPFLREWLEDDDRETFADEYWELDHKRGTYWRWLRAVIGGQPVSGGDARSIRIEYRPLPAQPTIAENVGFQCLVAGLVRGLCAADHPLATLDREATERSFYGAVEDGLDADLAWITADGDRTTDPDVIYDELFAFARRGLREQGVPPETVETFLAPIEARWTDRTTPSRWKLARVRDHLDGGADFEDAVHEMQTEYVRRSGAGEPIVEWS